MPATIRSGPRTFFRVSSPDDRTESRSSRPSHRAGSDPVFSSEGSMSKALIIAEKPSVANDIARALGGFKKLDDYFESDEYVLSSAIGHLVEIAAPEEYDVKRGKWSFANLPGHPAALRSASDREDRGAAEAADATDQAQGRRRTHQRLRRRARRRTDLPVDRAACEGEAAGPAPVAAVDDAGRDPRRVRASCDQRRADASAGRRREEPLRGRLADRHQRHARDDRVQLEGRRLLPDDRRTRADADAVDRRRARRERIKQFVPRDYWEVQAEFVAAAGMYPGRWFDPKFKRTDEDVHQRDSRLWSKAAADSIVAACRGKTGTVTEEVEAVDVDGAGPVRPDDAAARSERPLRLLGEEHARARAGALRTPQGPDVPADRQPSSARGLPAHGRRHAEDAEGLQQLSPARGDGVEGQVGQAQQAHLRQLQDQRPLRDHPDAAGAEEPVGARAEALRPRRQALPRGVLPAGRIHGHDAHHRSRRSQVQDRGQGAGDAGLAAGLRQGGRGRRQSRRGRTRREAADREGRGGRPGHEAARALHRGDLALGDGRRRQADGRR